MNRSSSSPVRHPDEALLTRARAALCWWAAQTPPTPTSSVTGGGAIATTEQAVSRLVGNRPALALPNATYGLRTALLAAGVRPDDDVLVSALDWPSARAAVRSLGARAVPVAVDVDTLTVDPHAAAAARTPRTAAVLATHLHGVCADVPALRAALGADLPIIEDAAQAFGSTLDGRPAGALGDLGVFSFGPGKIIDAGELAVLTARDDDLLDVAIRLSQHPVRQRLRGDPGPELEALTGRAAPLSAVLAAHQLHHWPERSTALRAAQRALDRHLDVRASGVTRLAAAPRRMPPPGCVPLLTAPGTAEIGADIRADIRAEVTVSRSSATACAGLPGSLGTQLQYLADRVRLLTVSEEPAGGALRAMESTG